MPDANDPPHHAIREEYRLRSRLAVDPEALLGAGPVVGQLNWISIGPSATLDGPSTTHPIMSGEVAGVAVSDDGERVYVASVNGGVFRSDDRGGTFYPLMSAFGLDPTTGSSDSISIGAFASPSSLPDRIYVGSGEDRTPAPIYGVGPVVSSDGGLSWTTEPYNPPPPARGSLFYGMAVDPNDPDLAVGATDQGIFRRQPRNQDERGLPTPRPQSYLIQMDTTNGNATDAYWDQDGLDTTTAWSQAGAWAIGNVASTTLTPFVFQGKPRFLRYVPAFGGGNNAFFYEVSPSGEPTPVGAGATWTQNLLTMVFGLSGSVYIVQYNTATFNADLCQITAAGALTPVWVAQAWGNPWTAFVPFVLYGSSYFIKYNSAAANTAQLWRWPGNLTPVQVGGNLNLPQAAQLVPVTLDGASLLLVYEPTNNGQATLYRWAANGTLVQLWQRTGVLPNMATAKLSAFSWNGEPRLLANGTGAARATTLYRWGPDLVPVPIWTRRWADNLILMPSFMGYTWADKQASVTPAPLRYDATDQALVENRRVTSVVSASDGSSTVLYAAFSTDVIADPAVDAVYKGRGQVYVSLDRGATWEQLGVFPPNEGRIALAAHPTDINVVYAMTEAGRVYRYERGGGPDFARYCPIEGAPGVMSDAAGRVPAIAVSRTETDTLFVGGDRSIKASDGRSVGDSGALYRCRVTRRGTVFHMTPTYIGTSLPKGLTTFGFTPSEEDLWVGTRQGLFHTTVPQTTSPTALERMFVPRNNGLSTALAIGLAQDPTTDAVLFSGGQGGGLQRYQGDDVWQNVGRISEGGAAVTSNDGQTVLVTGTLNTVYRFTAAGAFQQVAGGATGQVQLTGGDRVSLYAPLSAATAMNRVAFGTCKPWCSDDLGATWSSVPNDSNADILATTIRAIALSPNGRRLYVGLDNGQIWRFRDQGGHGAANWTAGTRIDNAGVGTLAAFIAGVAGVSVSDIFIDPGDDQEIFVTLAGDLGANPNPWQRVWRFAGGAWGQASGPGGGPATQQLMNIDHHAITGYRSGGHTLLYAGADLGVWHSANDGAAWAPMAEGLPEAAVRALRYYPRETNLHRPNLLRAGTLGRGVHERVLTPRMASNPRVFTNAVQLYMRANVLDRGLINVQDNVANPVDPGQVVRYWDGTDIKLSTQVDGQFPLPPSITPTEFAALAAPAPASIVVNRPLRVYVRIHNRGVLPAKGVRVTIVVSTAVAGGPPPAVPNLPGTVQADVRGGTLVADGNWTTAAIVAAGPVAPGSPWVVGADIPGNLLSAPLTTFTIVALATSPDDLFTTTTQVVATMVTQNSKVIMKYVTTA